MRLRIKWLFIIISIMVASKSYAQDSININLLNSKGERTGKWTEKLKIGDDLITLDGNYRNGKKVGLWHCETFQIDYSYEFEIEYLCDSSIFLFPNKIRKGGQSILIDKDSSIFIMEDNLNILIRRWCERCGNEYKCYEFDPKTKVLKHEKIIGLLSALGYILRADLSNSVYSYLLLGKR